MTDLTTPGEINAAVDNTTMGHAMSKAGGHGGYIVDGVDLAANFPALNTSGIVNFAYENNNGLDATFNGGEAFISGWLARDTQTTLSLPANSITTIYVGYDASAVLNSGQSPADSQNIILGPGSDFEAADPRVAIYDISTDGSGVVGVTDQRPLGRGHVDSEVFASASEFGSLQSDYNSFRESGGSVGGAFTAPRYRFPADGSAARFMYDTEITGQKLHFQREVSSAETSITVSGTNVGVNDVEPSVPLDVGGAIQSEGDRVPTADDDMHFVVSSSEPDEYDVWFEVE